MLHYFLEGKRTVRVMWKGRKRKKEASYSAERSVKCCEICGLCLGLGSLPHSRQPGPPPSLKMQCFKCHCQLFVFTSKLRPILDNSCRRPVERFGKLKVVLTCHWEIALWGWRVCIRPLLQNTLYDTSNIILLGVFISYLKKKMDWESIHLSCEEKVSLLYPQKKINYFTYGCFVKCMCTL